MSFFLGLGQLVFQNIPLGFLASALTDPVLGGFLLVVVVMTWTQARRQAQLEERLWGLVKNPPLLRTATALVYGIIGGLLGSLIISFIGVPFTETANDFLYLWLAAMGLSLLHPRLLCFAYAAGLLGVTTLLFGWPGIGIARITALVAVLHLVEAVLVWLDGGAAASPVVVRRPGGEVVGGFSVQRLWPVPLTLLLATAQHYAGPVIATPAWWPLIRIAGPLGLDPNALLLMVPVVAGLGYADLAVAETVTTKTRRSAGRLALYAVTLLGLSLLADRSWLGAWAAVLFSPLGHEWVIWSESQREQHGTPYWQLGRHGVRVLDVLPHTPAAAVGLVSGSLILAVDGQLVSGRDELKEALQGARSYCLVQFQGPRDAVPVTRRLPAAVRDYGEAGLILVPEQDESPVLVMTSQGLLQRLLSQVLGRLRRRDITG
ncbi:MAG: PDZ domain-containing protein [Symbiobacteriia bacterium]